MLTRFLSMLFPIIRIILNNIKVFDFRFNYLLISFLPLTH